MSDCIFCRIASGEIPASVVFQDDQFVAFHDLNPQAPSHVLVIPRRHVATTNELTEADDGLMGALIRRGTLVARALGHAESGYRLVLNCNRDGGQSVFHIHLHVLAGRPLGWPPG
jgi:histidine triad (HIT) family protein